MLVSLFVQTICLALLTVGLTGGLWIAAYGEGGLLSPLSRYLERFGKSEQLLRDWLEAEQELNRANANMEIEKAKSLSKERDIKRYAYNRYAIWRKPLLLCVRCMPSLYGIILGVPMLFFGLSPLALLLAIPMASVINTLLFTFIKM